MHNERVDDGRRIQITTAYLMINPENWLANLTAIVGPVLMSPDVGLEEPLSTTVRYGLLWACHMIFFVFYNFHRVLESFILS